MVQRLLRPLIVLGSRTYLLSIILTSIVVGMESCKNDLTCEDDCGGSGGGGGVGLAGPGGGSGVECGGKECPSNACAKQGTIYCTEDNVCAGEKVDGINDGNACTVDSCDSETGVITHRPVTVEEMDDGNACTVDECNPGIGITHTKTC